VNCPLIVIGAGGHGSVVADALLASGRRVIGFTDADPSRRGHTVCGLIVLGDDAVLSGHDPAAVELVNGIGGVGNGADRLRREVQRGLEARGWRFATVRHPSAVVSPFCRIGAGAQLLAGCIVQAGADIGPGCIVNTGSVVEHDVRLGAFSHVAPRAVLCGNVVVGDDCHIGAGAIVRQGVAVADGAVLGAGAVVLRNCARGVWVGIPAKSMEQRQ
jgi:sugar O-acyltransferase (sialic acid O-acetyltransferase NeuD family)